MPIMEFPMSMRTMLNLSMLSVLSVVAFMTHSPFASSCSKSTQANVSQNKNRGQGNNGGNSSFKNGGNNGGNSSFKNGGNNQGFHQGNSQGGNHKCHPGCYGSNGSNGNHGKQHHCIPLYIPGCNHPGVANNSVPGSGNSLLNNSLLNNSLTNNSGPGQVPGIQGPNGLGQYGPFPTERRALEVVQLFRAMGYPNTIQFHNGDGQYVLPRR